MPLTADEKARIAHHLGHPNLSEPATWALGIPMLTEQNSLLLRALGVGPGGSGSNLIEERLPLLRKILCKLDALDEKLGAYAEDLEVDKIGDIDFLAPAEFLSGVDSLRAYWVGKLEEYLGVPRNPFMRSVQSGINLRVC